MLTAFVGSGSW